ncbi:MAG: hypothetical protein IT462_18060 [Planctomycetes bacterium]|nr:hypothetical protein [Planctomycetota bacterium]
MKNLIRIALLALALCPALGAQAVAPMYGLTSWSSPPVITSGMTPVNFGDDELSPVISPQYFAFPYFGEMYTSFRIGSNGYLVMGASGATTSKVPAHSTAPGLCIAPFWGDLIPIGAPNAVQAQWKYDALTGKLVVKWGQHEVRDAGPNTPTHASLSLQLKCADGEVLFWYGKLLQTPENRVYGATSPRPHTVAISGPNGPEQEIYDGISCLPDQIAPDGSVLQYPMTNRPPEVHIQFLPTPRMLTITTMQMVPGIAGQDYAFQFGHIYGVGAVHWRGANLPQGWVMSDDGVLSAQGQYAVTGQHTFDVTAFDDQAPVPNTRTRTFSVEIFPGALGIFTPADLPVGDEGVDYATQFAALGGMPPFTWTATNLPQGFTLASTGLLSALGASVIGGDYYFDVQVVDDLGNDASGSFHLRIDPPPLDITSPAQLPRGVTGHEYRFVFTATGGFAPYRWQSPALPPAWTLNLLSGELVVPEYAATLGNHVFAVDITDTDTPAVTTTEYFTLDFVDAPAPLAVNPLEPPHARVNLGYSHQFYATGGVGPYTWSAVGIPAGWSLSDAGRFTGVAPATPGQVHFVLVVADSQLPAEEATLDIVIYIDDVVHPPLEITTTYLPKGKTGEPYSGVLLASGGGAGHFQWTLTAGTLPDGVEGLPGSGTPAVGIYGTPKQVGAFVIYVQVTDAAGQTANKQLSILVEEGTAMNNTDLGLGDGAVTGCSATGNGSWVLPALAPLMALALRRRRRA